MRYILAIDLGTTGNRIIAFDRNARIASQKYKEFKQIYPEPGYVEHDPDELSDAVDELLEQIFKEISLKDVAAIGIANQRETVVCWNRKTGRVLHNAIVWQDCRTQEYCKQLNHDKELVKYVHENTGLKIDPYFSGTKIKWILDNVVEDRTDVLFGTIDTWIIWKLTKKHVTDHTNASRTMLYNLHTQDWDEKLMKLFGVTREMLPKIVDSSGIIADYKGIPIAGIAGDQQAALFGQRCFEKGDIKNTYGTGCFCLINTGKEIIRSNDGLLTTVAAAINGDITYALEGSVFIAGAVVQWLRDEMKIINNASDTEEICNSIPDTNGVFFIPAFAGLGTPYWNTEVRGAIFGLTRGANKKHIIRAAVESIALQSKDLIDVMDKSVASTKSLLVDGGATNNNFLMQFQADILGKDIVVPETSEITALGAGFLAGLAIGFWKDIDELKKIDIKCRRFHPNMDDRKRNSIIKEWKKYTSQLLK